MKKSTRAILIAAIALFIAGGMFTAIGAALGGGVHNWPYQSWSPRAFRYLGMWNKAFEKNQFYGALPVLSNHGETLPPFDAITMDTNLGSIVIDYGSEYRIDFKNCALPYISWSVQDSRLIITENSYDIASRRLSPGFGDDSEIKITLPQGSVLTGLIVDHDLGSLSCRLPIRGRVVDIELDLGSAWLSDIAANSIELSLDLGELNASSLVADRFTAELNLGSAELPKVAARHIDVDCNLGSLSLNIIGSLSDYSYDVEASLGSIKLDGASQHGKGRHSLRDNTRPYTLKAEVDMGDINISFTQPGGESPFVQLDKLAK